MPTATRPKLRCRIRDLTTEDMAQIEELVSKNTGTRTIAEILGISRKVVRSLTRKPDQDLRTGKLDSSLEAITQRVAKNLTTSRILREIREQGYSGGRTILAEKVRQLKSQLALAVRRKAKRRFETGPGAEMQVDWCSENVEIADKSIKVHILGIILAYSRRLFIGFYRDERESTLLEGLAQGFEYFQGCAMRCVFDNMSTVVLGRLGPDRKPLWHPRFLEFSRHYGFEPFLCAVADPDRKGKIEKSFRLVADDFLKGSSFTSWTDMQQRARIWLDRTSNVGNLRVHGTTGLVPNDAYLAERDLLIKLPEHRFPVYEETIRSADQDSTISVKNTRYSVPAELAGRQVIVRLFAEHFEVFARQGRLLSSCRYVDPATFSGNLVIDPTHYARLPRRPDVSHGGLRMDQAFVRRFPMLEPLVDGLKQNLGGIAHVHLYHLLRLSEEFGLDAFLVAAIQAQDYKRFNAYAVRRILEKTTPIAPDSLPTIMNGLGPTILGEVEEAGLEEFAHLDQHPPTKEGTNGE